MSSRDLVNLLAGTVVPFLWGHVAPVRPSMMTTLQHPEYRGACTFPGCFDAGSCDGNRVFYDEAGKLSIIWWVIVTLVTLIPLTTVQMFF